MSGDFGYILMGGTDGIVDNMDGFMTSGNLYNGTWCTGYSSVALQLVSASATVIADGADNQQCKIGYVHQAISGFQFGMFSHKMLVNCIKN